MGTQLLLILLLIVANGIFAMAEIAVVSARRARLEARAEGGDEGARRALELSTNPTRFLSTVQIGITLVGIFAGAYGGATIALELGEVLNRIPALRGHGDEVALAIVVVGITYLTLVLGEIVPKRIALTHPERIATVVARPMHALSVVATPVVKLLSWSTERVIRLFRIRKPEEPPVTEEEIEAMVRKGAEAGVFAEEERQLVERVFALGDRRVGELMTPRHRMVWLDLEDAESENRAKMVEHRFSRYPVCEGGVDNVRGVVDVRDLWARAVAGEPLSLESALTEPLFVPEGLHALRLLDRFRETGIQLALVVDEYGGTEGLITVTDILDEISGEMIPGAGPQVVQREDGSWLVDASLTMDEFWDALSLEERRGEERHQYNTLGGFVITRLGRIPRPGQVFEAFGLRFEVVDMDGHRVDKVLVGRIEPTEKTR